MNRRELPIALLRIAIGWHFLYEGCSKLLQPGWTSAGYLQGSTGPLSALFQWLGSNGTTVLIDQLNIWGLILVGLGLMVGLFVQVAAWGGIALLALYYLAYPPFFSALSSGSAEGSYLVVNKNLVEIAALAVVAAFNGASFSLDALRLRRKAAPREADKPLPALLGPIPRRELVANLVGLPVLGAFVLAVLKKHGWKSFEETQLTARTRSRDTFIASATVKRFKTTSIRELKGRLPYARIGNVQLSRMILGGNLIGGWAHARDLIYVSSLVKAYHHRDKVFETLALAERCGVNTFLTNPLLCQIVNDYWRSGGRIQFISDCGGQNVMQMIQQSIDAGACACYIQGGVADRLVQDKKFDLIASGLELIRRNKLPAGIGAHKLETVQACVERGLMPDFWMKTLHRVDYWSAKPQPEKDNIWCDDPVATAAYMRELKQPWIAYKVLAAGAIEPKVGFQEAFQAGADFICVGMYDFQIVEDVNIALAVLKGPIPRDRPWYA